MAVIKPEIVVQEDQQETVESMKIVLIYVQTWSRPYIYSFDLIYVQACSRPYICTVLTLYMCRHGLDHIYIVLTLYMCR